MRKGIKDSVVVVTGGAGRIGSEFIRAVAMNGAIAIIADTNEDAGRELENELIQKGFIVEFFQLDITSSSSVESLINELHEKYSKIDALVNNAYPRNSRYGRKFEDVTYEDFCDNVSTHLGGYFLMSQQFSLYFCKQGHGNIVNMASVYGVVAPRFDIYENTEMTMPVEYAAIKSALVHLTKYIAQYMKRDNVRVNCISPGGILDKQSEMFLQRYNSYAATKGMLNTEDIKGLLLFLLSDDSMYINGQNIVIDDGWSL